MRWYVGWLINPVLVGAEEYRDLLKKNESPATDERAEHAHKLSNILTGIALRCGLLESRVGAFETRSIRSAHLSRRPDTPSQTTLAPGSAVYYAGQPDVCGACALKARLYERKTAFRLPPPVRRCLAAHAATCDAGGDAAATVDRRASVCFAEMSHLWAPALLFTWTSRCAD